MFTAYIALGANLGQPDQQLREALLRLERLPDLRLIAQSPFYRTAPMGPEGQPYYCNAVCIVETSLGPEALLEQLLAIERAAGRVRGEERWGPRLLDLDMLHVEGERRDTPSLHLPHPGIAQRNFVLVPLGDVAPDLVIPGVGRVADLASRLGDRGLERWPD